MEIMVSLAQISVNASHPEENLKKGEAMINEAARRGSDIICFPEMWTTGFDWENNARIAFGQEKVIEQVADMARRHRIWINGSMLALDENRAVGIAQGLVDKGDADAALIYGSSKRALSRWVRRESIKPQWAGAGIPLNTVGPGIVETPMVADMIATPEAREAISAMVPMPLNGYLEAENVASLLIWLASAENTHTTGQTIYIDGGSDAVLRGENIWDLAPQA